MAETKNVRLRTTIKIETDSRDKFEECLQHAIALAREGVIQMSFSLKDDPDTRYEVRTSRMRGKRK